MPFRLTLFDNFHPYEPDEQREGGVFPTLDAAIAAAKAYINGDLAHFLEEERQSRGEPTPERLFSRFRSFGELPVVYDEAGKSAFDGWAYCRERTGEMCKKQS